MSKRSTYLLRHAPSMYSVAHRVNGDPAVDVPLTAEGVAAVAVARSTLLCAEIQAYMSSTFVRCTQTAELLMGSSLAVHCDARLNELDYGVFEGRPFLDYAHWLAAHGPYVRPPGARESQYEGVVRMLFGLRDALDWPGPLLVVAHGLLVSVIQWARCFPHQSLREVFLPSAPYLRPVIMSDAELCSVTTSLSRDLVQAMDQRCRWHVDLGVFPREVRAGLATVVAHATDGGQEDGAGYA